MDVMVGQNLLRKDDTSATPIVLFLFLSTSEL